MMANIKAAARINTILQTSFLIPNLHCPSCVNRITELMSKLEPPPTIQNISIIDHVVTVNHSESVSATTIARLLESAAYEVYDIILDPLSHEQTTPASQNNDHFSTAIQRWSPGVQQVEPSARAEHEKNCESCAAHTSAESSLELKSISIASSAPDTPKYLATLSVEGMTCSSCVGTVTGILDALPGVIKAEVALITQSALVQFTAEKPDAFGQQLTEAVEDAGYGAELTELKPISSKNHATPKGTDGLFEVVYSIADMSCSSCVGKITKSVQELKFIQRVDINLMAHSGTITYHGQSNEPLITEAISRSGYTPTKVKTTDVSGGRSDSRTVSLRIAGMHCNKCPQRIIGAMEKLSLEVEKPPTLEDPIVTISYVPNAPALTIRTIIAQIENVDKSFTVSIHHPQSVEERARKMLAKERRSIFYRALFTIITAIPTFIIGIVYMDLVSHSNSGYLYLMQPLHGVSRAEWATFIMSTLVYFYGADHFHRRTIKELYAMWRPRSSVPILRRFYRFGSMNMLITFGTTIAYFSSLGNLIAAASGSSRALTEEASRHTYFDSVVFLCMFLLIGRLIEAQMKAKSGDAVSALGKLRPTEASLILEEEESGSSRVERVSVDLIDIGDVVRIPQGASPPCDGILLDEGADLDESSLTGESRVIRKSMGDEIYSGTINKGSAISTRVTGAAGGSLLDSIIQIVREGQAKRAPMERVADLLTAYFVPVVVLIAIVTWIIWLSLGLSGALPTSYLDSKTEGWLFWSLQFAIAVFVIACPCGLGLAAPTALFVGGGMAASRGILVKGGGEAFQEASTLDAIVFDKTGTLTEGTDAKIVDHRIFSDIPEFNESRVLGLLKTIEENSSHPLAKAVVEFASGRSAPSFHLSSVDEIAGSGLKASLASADPKDKEQLEGLVGNENLMKEYGINLPDEIASILEAWKSAGRSVILFAVKTSNEWQLAGILAAADPLRQEAREVIKALHSQGIAVWMLSGDNPGTAKAVGAEVGIPAENIVAGVLPSQKAEKMKQLQASIGKSRRKGFLSRITNQRTRATVAMVGDGINDAPSFAAADVGIAVASGSDVAIQSAAFVLVHSDLRAVLTLVTLSRAVFRRVIQNFFWAAIYNIIALPIAAGVLYPIKSGGSHVKLDPAWAALAMALSSITVVTSSLLLRTRIPLVGFRDKSVKGRMENVNV